MYTAGDEVFYQEGTDKKWKGPVKVLEQATNSEIKLDIPESNGSFKRVHKCKVARKYSDPEEDMTVPETTTEDNQSVNEISNEDDRESTGHPTTTPTTRMTRSKTKQIQFAAESNNNTTSVDFLAQAKEHQKN